MNPKPAPRHTAYLAKIRDILNAEVIREGEGGAVQFFLRDRGITLNRANLMATVVAFNNSTFGFEELIIDDGSGVIPVRGFDGSVSLNGFEVGAIVNVIGRVREFGGSRYIVPELVKKIEDKRWVMLRELEIRQATAAQPEMGAIKPHKAAKEGLDEGSPGQSVYELIKELDSGNGVAVQELATRSGVKNIDAIIARLIEEGEIFQIAPGRVKAL